MATPEENKATWRRFVEEVPNKGNVGALDELVDEDVVFYTPELVRGREALKEELEQVADGLNGRPRQTLGWMTPSEKLAEVVATTA